MREFIYTNDLIIMRLAAHFRRIKKEILTYIIE